MTTTWLQRKHHQGASVPISSLVASGLKLRKFAQGNSQIHAQRHYNQLPSYTAPHIIFRDFEHIIDGHKSFPSGHSSTMFAGMGFLFFWLAGKTAAWCFSEPFPPRRLRSTRAGRIIITLVPLTLASWVAITRVEDYVCCVYHRCPFKFLRSLTLRYFCNAETPQRGRHRRQSNRPDIEQYWIFRILAQPVLVRKLPTGDQRKTKGVIQG